MCNINNFQFTHPRHTLLITIGVRIKMSNNGEAAVSNFQVVLSSIAHNFVNRVSAIVEPLSALTNWSQFDKDQIIQVKLAVESTESVVAGFELVAILLEYEPDIVSSPLHVDRINVRAFPADYGDMSIAHYNTFHQRRRRSNSQEGLPRINLSVNNTGSAQYNKQIKHLFDLGMNLRTIFSDIRRVFFTNLEMTADLSAPLIEIITELRTAIDRIQSVLRSKSSSSRPSTPTKTKSSSRSHSRSHSSSSHRSGRRNYLSPYHNNQRLVTLGQYCDHQAQGQIILVFITNANRQNHIVVAIATTTNDQKHLLEKHIRVETT